MLPKYHLFFGMIFSLLLLIIFPQIKLIGFFIILFSTILIDVDHYLFYVYKKKDLNLRNAYNWFKENINKYNSLPEKDKRGVYSGVFFLHGFEAIVLILLVSSHFAAFLFVLVGFIFHQALDLVDLIQKRIKPYKVISFTYSIFKSRNKKFAEEI